MLLLFRQRIPQPQHRGLWSTYLPAQPSRPSPGLRIAQKAALEMATRVAALEAEPGLGICSLAPGVVDTPMQAVVRSADASAFRISHDSWR